MGKDVTDGKYAGELTPREVIEQFEYRKLIHETYAGLVLDDPAWLPFGSYEFHQWAINGYDWGIKYIRENNPTPQPESLAEAISAVVRAMLNLFRKKGTLL